MHEADEKRHSRNHSSEGSKSEILIRMHRVAVIIPAYNEQDVIDDCLKSLVAQKFQNFKAFVINDSSTDQTREIIDSYARSYPERIELCEYGKVGPGRARNITAEKVSAEILAFMDADCRATPEWLSELIKIWDQYPESASVGGPHLAPPESTAFQQSVESFYIKMAAQVDFYKDVGGNLREVAHNPLCNVSYRRELFLALGGFREDLFPGEDIEMDLRIRKLGKRIFFNPKALVYHHRPKDILQFRKVMKAYGRAQGKLVRERGIERKIQIFGLLALALLPLTFWIRPRWNSRAGIYLNASSWITGFFVGLVTNSALPPQPPKR